MCSVAPAVALLVLFVVRMALLTTAWAGQRGRSRRSASRPGAGAARAGGLCRGSRPGGGAGLLGGQSTLAAAVQRRADGRALGALALIEHRAYWPFEFDKPSQQPIETREPYRALAGQVGHLPNRAEAAAADVCGFDYVLLMEADAVPGLPAERFRLLVRSGFAALYTHHAVRWQCRVRRRQAGFEGKRCLREFR